MYNNKVLIFIFAIYMLLFIIISNYFVNDKCDGEVIYSDFFQIISLQNK